MTLPAPEDKARFVERLFNTIAPSYDRLNDWISLGMHRRWKRKASEALNLPAGQRVLDLCTGTGDLVQYLAPMVGGSGQVVGADFSEGMLAVAQQRFAHHPQSPQLHWVQADALALPFEDASFDGAVVAFGLRNVAQLPLALSELARVLKPTATLVSLDTTPKAQLPGFDTYFKWVMPKLAALLGQPQWAYQYLQASSKAFAGPQVLLQLMQEAGLQPVGMTPLGFGSVALVQARKPNLTAPF